MHLKAARLGQGQALSGDVCIVGAGIAGTVLAHELAQSGQSVVLLEAGGMKGAAGSLPLYRGETDDPDFHLPPDLDRARGVGGTSSMWGGRCMPFDPIDFEPRDHVPFSGWPMRYTDIEPWFRRAQDYAECGAYDYESDAAGLKGDLVEGLKSDTLLMSSLERWSPPTHFGKKLGRGLARSENVTLVTGAVAVGLEAGSGANEITRLRVRSVKSNRDFFVSAKRFVLAGGGLETTRLLLASARQDQAAIGDHSGWLGRGYMCHVGGVIARVVFSEGQKTVFGYEQDHDEVYVRRRFTLSDQAQRHEKLPNMYALLDRPLLEDASHGSASLSLLFLIKRLVQRQSADTVDTATGTFALYKRHLRNLVLGAPEVMTVLPRFGRQRFLRGRRVPSLLLASKNNSFYLYYHAEQFPNRDSRVVLSDEADETGLARLRIEAKLGEPDVEAIKAAHRAIDRELRASDVGRLEFLDQDVSAAIRRCKCTLGHHIGTTRMAANPAHGVVDENAKVHEMQNLFVASSSVFPTSGQAHPTLTILAFALRLADHLKEKT